MIKIIKYGNKRRIECNTCGAILQYEKEDIKMEQVGMNEYEKRITCPVCMENIVIER